MNGEPGRINAQAERIVDDLAVEIDGHEVGSGHFLEAHPIGIDQEAVMSAREAGPRYGV